MKYLIPLTVWFLNNICVVMDCLKIVYIMVGRAIWKLQYVKSYFLKDRYNVSNPLPSISHRKICKLLLNLLTHQYHPFSSEIFELCLLPFLFNRNLFVATKLDQYGVTTYAKYKTLRGPIGARLCYKNQDAF